MIQITLPPITEKQLFQKVKRNLKGCEVMAVENVRSTGFPDLIAWSKNRACHLELKVCRTKGMPSDIKKLLSPNQVNWHRARMFNLVVWTIVWWAEKEKYLIYHPAHYMDENNTPFCLLGGKQPLEHTLFNVALYEKPLQFPCNKN